MATELPPVNREQVAQFWQRCLSADVVPATTPLPGLVEPFGDSAELADELIELVVHGPKRATAGALVEYEADHTPIPTRGTLSVATDGSGCARALLRTTEVRVGPLSSVDDAFAWDEGEGDRTRACWLADHHHFFGGYLPTIGVAFDPEMQTVFERFEVLFSE